MPAELVPAAGAQVHRLRPLGLAYLPNAENSAARAIYLCKQSLMGSIAASCAGIEKNTARARAQMRYTWPMD